MNPNLFLGLGYALLGLTLIIGGVIVPLKYTVLPLSRANSSCPMHLVWRLVLKLLFGILMLQKAFIHLYIEYAGRMPKAILFEPIDGIVMIGLAIALIATWLTHPDGIKSI
jgi:hypothetical protein